MKYFFTRILFAFLVYSIFLLLIHDTLFVYPRAVFITAAILLAAAFSFILASRLNKPLRELTRDLIKPGSDQNQTNSGDDPSDGADDISVLRNSWNRLAQRYKDVAGTLDQEKQRLEAILTNMSEGVIVLDPEQKIQLITESTREMVDLRGGKTIGRPFWEVIVNSQVNTAIYQALDEKNVIERELTARWPREEYFIMRLAPLYDSEERLISLTIVFYDITRLKKLENYRKEFVANVSHELKTPLTSIKGFVETLADGAIEDPVTSRRFLEIITRHTHRLENLVNDLLSLSTLESKESIFSRDKVNLNQLISRVCGLAGEQIKHKGQELQLTLDSGLSDIACDMKKMEQVFTNLLDNAVKYTPANGAIKICTKDEDKFVRVEVSDNGPGIPAEHIPRLFERFYRIDKDRSREVGGTGLGLAIVKHIINGHHGRIEVTSQLNKGSTFTVFLPRDPS